MSFYRTYRPQVIDEIDNVIVRERLHALLKKQKKDLPHAFLLSGPKGAGKTTTARIIAKLFNCEKEGGKGPCGKCPSCKSIENGTSLDVLEIDAASNRGIDDIRLLRERIGLAPTGGNFTIYIIDEVHMLTTEAFNALLKTLEEPPLHAVFVLATTDKEKVPVTVQSRCVLLQFRKATDEELFHALSRIKKEEHIEISDDGLLAIASIADGAFRDAVKLLEQVSFLDGEITVEAIHKLLSQSDGGERAQFLTAVFRRDKKGALAIIEQLVAKGVDMKTFVTDCLSDLLEELTVQIKGQVGHGWDRRDAEDFIRRLTEGYALLRTCPLAQLPILLVTVEFCDQENSVVIPKKELEVKKEEKNVIGGHAVQKKEEVFIPKPEMVSHQKDEYPINISEFLTIEKLISHWPDFIESLKPYNHSVAGVIRGARPKSVVGNVVTIEALYTFHQERLSEPKVRDILSSVLKKLFGASVKVEIVLGKK